MGIVFGLIILVLIVVAIIFFPTKRRRKNKMKNEAIITFADRENEEKNKLTEFDEMIKHVNSHPYPELIKGKLLREINKLANVSSETEGNVSTRNYIETLMSLPYWQQVNNNFEINEAKEIIEKNLFGLSKQKSKIIEFLAVKQNNFNLKGPSLLLVGPPGVGKTTLAQSVATALDKPLIKISLKGIHEKEKITGFSRNHSDPRPGQIISAMKTAGIINPVILLDGIDKMSLNSKNEFVSTMLEILDYEQNKNFKDHYLEEYYDLSNVTFIVTGNYINQIPEILYEQFNIIEFYPYAEVEKIEIAKKYLIPATINDIKISEQLFSWSDDTIDFIIQRYTNEPGVKQLKKMIEEVAKKILVLKLNGEIEDSFPISQNNISKLLDN